jgi:hypothetical protein
MSKYRAPRQSAYTHEEPVCPVIEYDGAQVSALLLERAVKNLQYGSAR